MGVRTLRVLIVEDSADDYELLCLELARKGYDVESRRVATAAELRGALDDHWDVVISDWVLPTFSPSEALAIVRASSALLPFIFVSGVVGEEIAVQAMRDGAQDFIPKGRLTRLVPAIERELRDGKLREEHERMRLHLSIAERLATTGMLAAGIAHEINNPLAAALAHLELAQIELPSLAGSTLASVQESLHGTAEACLRIRDLVAELRMFSRSHDASLSAVDVNGVLTSILKISANEIRPRARLVRELGPVPPVQANESRLALVLSKLLVNAVQSIPEGRSDKNTITVATRMATDGRVEIEVRDTGAGMTPEARDRLFIPFFRTEIEPRGHGLRLAICHRIVDALGGEIAVESSPGLGSSFFVLLPASPS